MDASHSDVRFKVKHMMITNLKGGFGSFRSAVETEGDDFSTARIQFDIDVNSIETNNPQRNGHLLSDDFFNAERFPVVHFESHSLSLVAGDEWKVKGALTIRDITKEVEFKVICGGVIKDPYGMTRVGFDVSGEISRLEFGLKWNMLIETGGAIVSDAVKVEAAVEYVKA